MKNKFLNLKSIFIMAVMMCFLCIGSTSVYAETTSEVEPNNSREEAETIKANAITPTEYLAGNHQNSHVINGYTSKTDEDWYRVYLKAGTQYVTCNDNNFQFEVYAPNNDEAILSETYIKTGFGVRAYEFAAPVDGYYFVKVVGITSSSKSYILEVGAPSCMSAKLQYKFNTVTMSNGNVSIPFDLRSITALPDDAVVDSISISGVRSNDVNGISLTNNRTGRSVNLSKYTWNKRGLASLNLLLKSRWTINYTYSQNKSFTPTATIYYVYQVTSEYAEDPIVVGP